MYVKHPKIRVYTNTTYFLILGINIATPNNSSAVQIMMASSIPCPYNASSPRKAQKSSVVKAKVLSPIHLKMLERIKMTPSKHVV